MTVLLRIMKYSNILPVGNVHLLNTIYKIINYLRWFTGIFNETIIFVYDLCQTVRND